jgi:hypothetical protein
MLGHTGTMSIFTIPYSYTVTICIARIIYTTQNTIRSLLCSTNHQPAWPWRTMTTAYSHEADRGGGGEESPAWSEAPPTRSATARQVAQRWRSCTVALRGALALARWRSSWCAMPPDRGRGDALATTGTLIRWPALAAEATKEPPYERRVAWLG